MEKSLSNPVEVVPHRVPETQGCIDVDASSILNINELTSKLAVRKKLEDAANISPYVSFTDKERLINILSRYKECLDAFSNDIGGNARVAPIKLTLRDNIAVRTPPYRVSLKERQIMAEIVEDMKRRGIVYNSSSPYASPALLVRKNSKVKKTRRQELTKDDFRLCVEYRGVNKHIDQSSWPLERAEDIFARLANLILAKPNCKFTNVTLEKEEQYVIVPQLLKTGSATFSRCLIAINHLVLECAYLTDTLQDQGMYTEIYQTTEQECKKMVKKEHEVTLTTHGSMLNGKCSPGPDRIRKGVAWKRPVRLSQIKMFANSGEAIVDYEDNIILLPNNVKCRYTEGECFHFELDRCILEQKILDNYLTLAISNPSEFAYQYFGKPGYMAVARGEVIHISQCKPVLVVPRVTEQCFNELPVMFNNVTHFLTPRNRLLVTVGTIVECVPGLESRFKLLEEVRWLSCGKVLSRLFDLRQEVRVLCQQNNLKFLELLTDDGWMAKLAYLADIFSVLNDLTNSLQGECMDVFVMRNKIEGFQRKIPLWYSRIEDELDMFPNLNSYLRENDVNREVLSLVQDQLKALKESFKSYYPEKEDPRPGNMWMAEPFITTNKELLIEISSDAHLKSKFATSATKAEFWLSILSWLIRQSKC
ncbi:hypothetical protein WDU94_010818 [Cyamophila willieti]